MAINDFFYCIDSAIIITFILFATNFREKFGMKVSMRQTITKVFKLKTKLFEFKILTVKLKVTFVFIKAVSYFDKFVTVV